MEVVKNPIMYGSSANHTTEVSQLREAYEVSYALLNQALCFEEDRRLNEAVEMYYKVLQYINANLDIKTDLADCQGSRYDEARTIQGKMICARANARARIHVLSNRRKLSRPMPLSCATVADSDAHCSFENSRPSAGTICPDSNEDFRPTYLELLESTAGPSSATSTKYPANMQMSCRILCEIAFSVQLFRVVSNNVTPVENGSTGLKIFTLNKAYEPVSSRTDSWIQVGQFTYPLVPKISPVLKTGYGVYIFPEISLESNGTASFALVLGADVPDSDRALLDDIFEVYAAFQKQHAIELNSEGYTLGERISSGIISASEAIGSAIVRGAQATSNALTYGTERVRENLAPTLSTSPVDSRIQTGLKVARIGTHYTCKATGFMVNAVGEMAMALGRRLAKTVMEPEAVGGVHTSEAFNDAMVIVGGSIRGFSTVFMSLENAAKILAQSISSNTVTIVNHKYGDDASEAVGNALYSIGNWAMTVNNATSLGVKGIAKRTAKEVGKSVLEEYNRKVTTNAVIEEPLYALEFASSRNPS